MRGGGRQWGAAYRRGCVLDKAMLDVGGWMLDALTRT